MGATPDQEWRAAYRTAYDGWMKALGERDEAQRIAAQFRDELVAALNERDEARDLLRAVLWALERRCVDEANKHGNTSGNG